MSKAIARAISWRSRLAFVAMSAFVTWHTIAMVLAPVPESNDIVRAFRALFHPYVTLIGIDATWDFFSPIGASHQVRYIVEDAAGAEHTFTPIDALNWLTPTHRWYERIYADLMWTPELYSDWFIREFCRKHAALKPVAVALLDIEQAPFWPADFLAGNDPRKDPDYYTVHVLQRLECAHP